MPQKPIKLLIVDDSRVIRSAIKKIFSKDPQIEVAGEAVNGIDALSKIPEIQPDVITLDINMPKMDGLLTLKHIMIKHPTPTVMISSLTKEGATKTFDALRLGAINFIAKPSNRDKNSIKSQQQNILEKIKLAANINMKHVRLFRTHAQPKTAVKNKSPLERCVVLGASEGGYSALLKIVPQLKPEWPAAYLVVLHAAPAYVDAFVKYLDRHSPIKVERAINGKALKSGTCYLAAGSEYITAVKTKKKLSLRVHPSPFPERRGAINILMLSLSEAMPQQTVGVILSGQEQDGAEGAAEIARVGGEIIIQAPQTCLFKEMPEAAIEMCESGNILPDTYIADAIETYCNKTLNERG